MTLRSARTTEATPSRREWLVLLAFCVVVAGCLVVKPALAVVVAVLGLLFILFRQVDLDATTVLTVFLVCLALVPARYIVPSLGAVGTPAGVVALACGYWWLLERVVPRAAVGEERARGTFQPVHIALAVFTFTIVLAFFIAYARPLAVIEANGAARGLIRTAGLVGITLLAADGIRSRQRFDVLLNRVLNLASVMAGIALVQFFTDFDPVAEWTIPGLTLNQELATVTARSVVDRVPSTTLHPIEFGAVLAVLFPLALHTALFADAEHRTRRWLRLGLLTFAIPLSVSRTAVLVVVVVLLMMWPVWTWGRRTRVVVAGAAFLVGIRALVPGLLGTIRALFTGIQDDPSTTGRTEDYSRIWTYVGERPLLGRGLNTFDPSMYFFVDNEILMTLVAGGIVGLIGLLVLVGTAAVIARQVLWHAGTDEARHLGAALAAAIVGGFAGFFTFDALSFSVFAGLLFLLFGMAGALWRLEVMPYGRRYMNERTRALARS